MTDGLDISGGEFVVTKDGRQAINTAGHYVMGLPTSSQSLSKSITYPDFNKAWWFNWEWYNLLSGGGNPYYNFSMWNSGAVYVSALGQEWSQDTVLCAAPTVADGTALGFLGKIRLNRTKAPSHNVWTATLSMRVPANVWIPNSGSMLLESVEFGISRSLTCMISGGNLILRQRQSVTAAFPGGNGQYGDSYGGFTSSGQTKRGGIWQALAYDFRPPVPGGQPTGEVGDAYQGMLLYHDSSNDKTTGPTTLQSAGLSPTPLDNCWCTYNGNSPAQNIPSFTDPTDYSSVYTVDVEGEFVRLN